MKWSVSYSQVLVGLPLLMELGRELSEFSFQVHMQCSGLLLVHRGPAVGEVVGKEEFQA